MSKRHRRRIDVPVGDPIEVLLEKAAFGGEAMGHLEDGRVVFVPRTLPGELALVQLKEDRKDYASGEVATLERPAETRIDPLCPYFEVGCGGCSWRHAQYATQLAFKRATVVG